MFAPHQAKPDSRLDDHRPMDWHSLVAILSVAGCLFFCVQGQGRFVTQPARALVYLWGTLNLSIYLWIRVRSQWSQRFQLLAIMAWILLQVGVASLVRTDGFQGDGRVVFKWRWSPRIPHHWDAVQEIRPHRPQVIVPTLPSPDDFPEFRGVDRSGYIARTAVDWDWTTRPPRELWRRSVGQGWSAFSSVGEICITQEQRNDRECVVCYDLRSGSELWAHRDISRFEEITSGAGPRATPTIHEGRVYSLGATGLLNCLDAATGEPVWQNPLSHDGSTPLFGFSGSPLVYQGLVYVNLGDDLGSLVAIDRDTGKAMWRHGTRPAGYSSPQLLRLSQTEQILIFDGAGVCGHLATSGEIAWSYPWGDQSAEHVNVCQPVVLPTSVRHRLLGGSRTDSSTELLLISSGYGRGAALLALEPNGEVGWRVHERWKSSSLKSKFSSIVIRDTFAYGLDEGILTCISLYDGSRKWKRGRYGYGQLLLADEMLVIVSDSGRIHVVEASPHGHREISTITGLSDRTWNHPALAGRHLLIRNDREAVCYELPIRD